ncbi:MAG: hypothetical protein NZL89_00425 [Leptospiraceae bacterium]|nr:hypothetical protein [Leptospiraceae bacterium]
MGKANHKGLKRITRLISHGFHDAKSCSNQMALSFGVSVTKIKVLKKENKNLRVQIGGSLLGGSCPNMSQEVIPCEVKILPKTMVQRFVEYSAIPDALRQPTPASDNRMPSHYIRLTAAIQKDLEIDFLYRLIDR